MDRSVCQVDATAEIPEAGFQGLTTETQRRRKRDKKERLKKRFFQHNLFFLSCFFLCVSVVRFLLTVPRNRRTHRAVRQPCPSGTGTDCTSCDSICPGNRVRVPAGCVRRRRRVRQPATASRRDCRSACSNRTKASSCPARFVRLPEC